ncbi:hypothetical protein N7486_004046 [Penicillium sp. IBT 16267x]|nr:hypothetical protein N7486_004046 [Penicillium sp. IBT 16267x]
MAIPSFLSFVEHRNIANINQPYDIFENDRRYHIYSEDLLHEMHLRRHAEDVHRLATERNYYAKEEKEESGSDIDTD